MYLTQTKCNVTSFNKSNAATPRGADGVRRCEASTIQKYSKFNIQQTQNKTKYLKAKSPLWERLKNIKQQTNPNNI